MKSGQPPTGTQLKHAIMRNFGGMEDTNLDPLKEFMKMKKLSAMLQHHNPTMPYVCSISVFVLL